MGQPICRFNNCTARSRPGSRPGSRRVPSITAYPCCQAGAAASHKMRTQDDTPAALHHSNYTHRATEYMQPHSWGAFRTLNRLLTPLRWCRSSVGTARTWAHIHTPKQFSRGPQTGVHLPTRLADGWGYTACNCRGHNKSPWVVHTLSTATQNGCQCTQRYCTAQAMSQGSSTRFLSALNSCSNTVCCATAYHSQAYYDACVQALRGQHVHVPGTTKGAHGRAHVRDGPRLFGCCCRRSLAGKASDPQVTQVASLSHRLQVTTEACARLKAQLTTRLEGL